MHNRYLRGAVAAACALAMQVAAVPAMAGPITRDGFTLPGDHTAKVAVFRPDVRVGTMRTAGVDEPNAEWTDTARSNIQSAMKAQAAAQGIDMTFLGDLTGPDGELLDQYRSLFIAVSSAASLHGVYGNHLPSKLEPQTVANAPKKWRMDWTLGPDAAKLKQVTGADYALFFFTHDAYSSGGRKAASLMAAALFGVYVPTGVHEGYAGLVDLNTGDLVWFNTDIAMGGDPRETDGAVKRTSQLLAGFPARPGLALTAETAKK